MSGHPLPGDTLDPDTICGPKSPRPEFGNPELNWLLPCRASASRGGGWGMVVREKELGASHQVESP